MAIPGNRWFLRSALLAVVLLLALPLGMSARAAVRPRTSPSPHPAAAPAPFTVTDESHVLPAPEITRLKNTAASVGQHIWIYTTTRFATDKAGFDEYYQARLATLPGDSILIAVNTKSRHFLITSGPDSNLTDAAATTARGDFTYSFQVSPDYGLALNTTLQSISQSINVATPTPDAQDTPPASATSSGGGGGGGSTVLAVVVAIGLIVTVGLARRGMASAGRTSRRHRHHRYSTWSNAPAFIDTSSSDNSSSFDFGGSDFGGSDSGDSDFGGGGADADFGSAGDSGGGSSSGDF